MVLFVRQVPARWFTECLTVNTNMGRSHKQKQKNTQEVVAFLNTNPCDIINNFITQHQH